MFNRISSFIFILLIIMSVNSWTAGQPREYSIQVAAVENQDEASARIAELRKKGLEPYLVRSRVEGRGTVYRIRIGRYRTSTDARAAADRYRGRGFFSDFFIAPYEQPARATRVESSASEEKKPVIDKPDDRKQPEIIDRPATAEVPEKSAPPRAAADTSSRPLPRMAGLPPSPPEIEIKHEGWKAFSLPEMAGINLRSIRFVDALTGWIAGDGGSLFRTTDGGLSWKRLESGTSADLSQIGFVDWNNGWVVGQSASAGSVVLITRDGGRTWSSKEMKDISSIFFIDRNTGWAVGPTILKTVDGGETWETPTEPVEIIGLPVESSTYRFGFSDVFFLDAERGWLAGNFYGEDRNNIGGLFHTTDGGRKWRRVPLTLETQYTSGRFTPGTIRSVRFTDSDNGIVTGDMIDGEGHFFFILHTKDGGKTWLQQRTASSRTLSAAFLDLRNGWLASVNPRESDGGSVTDQTVLRRTDNGGMTWQTEAFAGDRKLNDIFFISSNLGWAVGDKGLIMKFDAGNRR
ncbi:MAG: YCF48-related protein [Blastocatellales bacterium]